MFTVCLVILLDIAVIFEVLTKLPDRCFGLFKEINFCCMQKFIFSNKLKHPRPEPRYSSEDMTCFHNNQIKGADILQTPFNETIILRIG